MKGCFAIFFLVKKKRSTDVEYFLVSYYFFRKLEKSVLGDESCVWTFREEDRRGGGEG